jgi:hypothetical protein
LRASNPNYPDWSRDREKNLGFLPDLCLGKPQVFSKTVFIYLGERSRWVPKFVTLHRRINEKEICRLHLARHERR